MTMTAQAYRSTTLANATHLDLLLATYDALAQDLRLASSAAQSGNIAERCNLSGHALLLLGHLESWTSLLGEPELESSLAQFYTFLRGEIMQHQGTNSAEGFSSLAMLVCEVRASWQGKSGSITSSTAAESAAIPQPERDTYVALSFSA